MEEQELKLLCRLLDKDERLRRLWAEHLELNKLVDELGRRRWLSEREQQQLKELKLRKLRGRQQIQAILRAWRQKEATDDDA